MKWKSSFIQIRALYFILIFYDFSRFQSTSIYKNKNKTLEGP